jgi:hypothetical protein
VSAGIGLLLSPFDHDAPLGLRFEAGANLVRVGFSATAASDAAIVTGSSQWTGTADATARGWARTGFVWWTLGAGATMALHAVTATDNGESVTSVEGVGGKVDAGVFFHFR